MSRLERALAASLDALEGSPLALVDLLFASSGIEAEIARQAEPLEVFSGAMAPVARTGHLIALKLLSRDDVRRPQDAVDLRALLGAASEDELALARDSAQIITGRGFNRGRDLAAALDSLIATGARHPTDRG